MTQLITGSLLCGVLGRLNYDELCDMAARNNILIVSGTIADVVGDMYGMRQARNIDEFTELLFDAPSASHKVVVNECVTYLKNEDSKSI